MNSGFYKEFEELRSGGSPDADFGFLENTPVGEAFNLYDYLHGRCDEFAAALSDFYGYNIEYIVGSDNVLIHAYCVTERNGGKVFVDARGVTTDAREFYDEFADFCTYSDGAVFDLKGKLPIMGFKNTREMYNDDSREVNQDKELYQFLKDNCAYYHANFFEGEIKMKTLKAWPKDLSIAQYLQAGDKVDNAMYEHFLNVTTPHASSSGFLQVGGACNTVENEDGVFKNTFLTFVKDPQSDCWIFKGECFSREWINRNPELESPCDKFKNSILSQLQKEGFDISQIMLSIEQFIDGEHKNCLWYGGPVATVEYKGHVFWLEAHGDVSVMWFAQDGFDDDEYEYVNKNNSGAYLDKDALDHFINDSHLKELDLQGRLAWQNNNWFEIFVETPDGVKHDRADVCNTDDLEDCIFEMIECMDLTIGDIPKNNIDNLIDNAKNRTKDVSSAKTEQEMEQ